MDKKKTEKQTLIEEGRKERKGVSEGETVNFDTNKQSKVTQPRRDKRHLGVLVFPFQT